MDSGIAELNIVEPITKSDGTQCWLSTCKVPLLNDGGQIYGILGTYMDVTMSKPAEDALRQSEERFRAFVENAYVGMCEADSTSGRFLLVNQRLCEITGYSAAELLERTIAEITHPDDRQQNYLDFQRQVREANTYRAQKRCIRKDGRTIWVDVCATLIRSADGEAMRGAAVVQDITEHKLAEIALRESEEEFRASFEGTSVGMTQCDPMSGAFLRVNQRFCELVGYSRDELKDMIFDNITHPDDQNRNTDGMWQLRLGKISEYRRDKRYLCKDGHSLWADVSTTLIRDQRGLPLRTVSVIQDITSVKLAADAQRESEEKFKAVVEQAGDAFFLHDADGRTIDVNQAAIDALGYSRDELLELCPWDFVAGVDRETGMLRWNALSPGQSETFEAVIRRKNGGEFPVEARLSRIDFANRKHFLVSVRDVSERKYTQEKVAMLAAIVESTEDAVIGKDLNGMVTSWNRAAEHLFGYHADEMIGQPIRSLIPFDRLDEEDVVLAQMVADEPLHHYETIRRRKDGSTVEVSVTVSPIKDEAGNIIGASKIARDISEKLRVARELVRHRDHLQEMIHAQTADLRQAKETAEQANQAKSTFLANMSHELRTPLHAILSFAKRGEDKALVFAPEKLKGYFANIAVGGTRLLALLNDLLDLAKLEAGRTKFDMARRNMRNVVDSVANEFAMLAAELGMAITVDAQTADLEAWFDGTAMQQVIRNIVSNALKFSPAQARILLRLKDSALSGERQVTEIGAVPALAIEISDQGCGIPEDELEAVFDKFIQSSKTRSQAGGTGLGLAICREIVAEHHGSIGVKNNTDKGVTFTVMIPRAAPTKRVDAPSVGALLERDNHHEPRIGLGG